MRTTVTIDDDVLAAARQLASLRHKSVGAVISELARSTLTNTVDRPTVRHGITLLPVKPGAKGSTLEEVNRLRDEVS